MSEDLVARVHTQHERVTVTVHGKPSAVLIATEDLKSLEESVVILSDPDRDATARCLRRRTRPRRR